MSAKIAFNKAAQNPAALLAKLKAANLIVPNDAEAIRYITFVGHYRLKGYWFHLIDPITKQFKAGITFDVIKERYECDRKVRAIILEAVERLELGVRNTICNFLSLKHNPHWYVSHALFRPTDKFGLGAMLSKIEQEVGRSNQKIFIEAYYKKYDDPYLPPSWAMSECVTLGIWSRIYQILKDAGDKKSIAAKFGFHQYEVFENWLHVLTALRNMASHHDRFLNSKLRISPVNNKNLGIKFSDNRSTYSALTLIHVLLSKTGFGAEFKSAVVQLQATYGIGMMQELGFPNHWPANAAGW